MPDVHGVAVLPRSVSSRGALRMIRGLEVSPSARSSRSVTRRAADEPLPREEARSVVFLTERSPDSFDGRFQECPDRGGRNRPPRGELPVRSAFESTRHELGILSTHFRERLPEGDLPDHLRQAVVFRRRVRQIPRNDAQLADPPIPRLVARDGRRPGRSASNPIPSEQKTDDRGLRDVLRDIALLARARGRRECAAPYNQDLRSELLGPW